MVVNEPLNLKITAAGEQLEGIPGCRYAVYGYVVILDTEGIVQFQGDTDLTGDMPMEAFGGIAAPIGTRPWFRTEPGAPLMIATDGPTPSGHLMYEIEGHPPVPGNDD